MTFSLVVNDGTNPSAADTVDIVVSADNDAPAADAGLDQNKTECRYRAFRDHHGTFTPMHWKILSLKLAFVIVFEVREMSLHFRSPGS